MILPLSISFRGLTLAHFTSSATTSVTSFISIACCSMSQLVCGAFQSILLVMATYYTCVEQTHARTSSGQSSLFDSCSCFAFAFPYFLLNPPAPPSMLHPTGGVELHTSVITLIIISQTCFRRSLFLIRGAAGGYGKDGLLQQRQSQRPSPRL